jgi:type I restriction enzyme S subunit
LPLVQEQQLIVHLLDAADFKLRAEEARRCALDTLFRTLLHTLMTGAVCVPPGTDPTPTSA